MSQPSQYEKIIDWFFAMLNDEKMKPAADEWLAKEHASCIANKCGCDLCSAGHRVVHACIDRDRGELVNGDPWDKFAAMVTISTFVTSMMQPDPEAILALLMIQREGSRIAKEHGLIIPEVSNHSESDVSELKSIQEIIKTIAALPAAQGKDQQNSTGTQQQIESQRDEQTMSTTQQNGNKDQKGNILDKTVATHLVGTEFFDRNGARVEPPKGLSYREMIVQLGKQAEEEERTVAVDERVDAFVLEGAYAFQSALKEKFGWVGLRPIPPKSFFDAGEEPKTIEVPVGPNETVPVIWGRVVIPGINGYLETGYKYHDGRFYFSVTGEVQQKFMPQVRELLALTQQHIKANSIYKGKAVRLDLPLPSDKARFNPENAPGFMDLEAVNPDELIFSAEVGAAITTNLFNPVEKTDLCRRLGIGLKRGNLLFGKPGTGKSLTAAVLAKKCVANGWTYFYVKHVKDVAAMYRLAAQYAPAVLFVEDIDQVAMGENRTTEMNELLNTLDGIDTKGAEVIVVCTSNRTPDELNSAFKRASRLDFIIEVAPPDASAVRRLIELYSRGRLASGISLDNVSKMLEGQIPATIKEVCNRALLSAVGHMGNDDDALDIITAADLETAAFTMLEQIRIATAKDAEYEPEGSEEIAADILGKHINKAATTLVGLLGTGAPNGKSANGSNGNGKGAHAPAES
jgi:transitional endoplasmic reticulum ATPase